MQEKITQRLDKTREQISAWRKDRLDDLQDGQKALRGHRQSIESRRDELVKQGSDAIYSGRGTVRTLEASALESARDFLGWAADNLGPRAEFLTRGENALNEALVSLRAGHSATLPIESFDTLSVKKVLLGLDGLGLADLRTLRAYETHNKNRKTLLRELDREIGQLGSDEQVS